MNFNPSISAEILSKHQKILIATHTSPDGDALGSLAAFAHICLQLDKDVRLLCQSPLPGYLNWLELPGEVHHSLSGLGAWTPDLLVCLDCGVPKRAGNDLDHFFNGKRLPGWEGIESLNIDHHMDNPGFATVNWVEPGAGATGELVGLLAEYMGLALAGKLGEAIYLGLTSDTGNFCYSNTSAGILRLAARIVENGLKVEVFTEKNGHCWSFGRMQLWGELIRNIRLFAGGQIVSSIIANSLLKKYGCAASDLEGFVSFIRQLKDVKVSLLVREKNSLGSKASLRSMGGENSINVQRVAAHFGGGGHRSAAGIEMSVSPEKAEKSILEILVPIVESAGR